MNVRVNKAIQASHAFDKGNERAVEWIQGERESIADQVYSQYELRYGYTEKVCLSPLHSIDSKESFEIQAADIAAGVAKYLYEIGCILKVAIHFEYVTFNGRRVSQDYAHEIMREWKQEGYL